VYFVTGDELTQLVMDEATRLRQEGADFIVYSIHDGYEDSRPNAVTNVTAAKVAGYYDTDLSDGYVDIVFEGHTHQRYILKDEHGVYHLQGGGDNKGVTHAKVYINIATGKVSVTEADLVPTENYTNMGGDALVDQLMEKYSDQVSAADRLLGKNSKVRYRDELRQQVADLYYEAALERWGEEYDIVLAGGFMSVRSPNSLATGNVTYGMVQSLFPFDNELVLCTISGRDLKNKFFETDNANYFISYGTYGEEVRRNIDPNATYYVVTDTYSSTYAPNNMTEVERYGQALYARDLLAAYIATGAYE
jgi:2',3'-cyclic-nucleotide 2'-phosphodiesterase (5'-nucleotidase family)